MTITSRGLQPIVTDTVFVVLAGLFVALRLFTRWRIVRNVGKEDFLILFALILSIGQTVTVYKQVHFGLGKHVSELTETEGILINKALFYSIVFYTVGLSTIKLSILFQYQRLFVEAKVRQYTWIMIGFVVSYGIFGIFSNVFLCVPVAKFWDSTLEGHCLKEETMWFLHASVNIVTDLCIWFLPMPTLYALHMRRGQKIVLMFIFGLGGFVCIVSVLRLWSIDVGVKTTDPTYDLTNAAILSSVEVNVAIICASMPMLKALLSKILPSLLGTNSDPYSRSGPGYMLSEAKKGASSRMSRTQRSQHTVGGGGTVTRINAISERLNGQETEISSNDEMNKGGIVMKTTIAQDVERGDGSSDRRLVFPEYHAH